MTLSELREALANEETVTLDAVEVRQAIEESDEVINGLETRLRDLQVDFDNTKEALDKARIPNARYYNNAIEVVKEVVEEKPDERYYATDEEIEEVLG